MLSKMDAHGQTVSEYSGMPYRVVWPVIQSLVGFTVDPLKVTENEMQAGYRVS